MILFSFIIEICSRPPVLGTASL